MVFFKTTQKIGRLRLCQSLSTLCKFVNALLMFFFQCTQQRPTLTMSKFVYVLYICTYWWWSSFHLYYQQKTDWHWLCQSHSTFCYNGDGLLSTFLSFPSVTSPPKQYYFGDGPKSTKEGWQKFLLSFSMYFCGNFAKNAVKLHLFFNFFGIFCNFSHFYRIFRISRIFIAFTDFYRIYGFLSHFSHLQINLRILRFSPLFYGNFLR